MNWVWFCFTEKNKSLPFFFTSKLRKQFLSLKQTWKLFYLQMKHPRSHFSNPSMLYLHDVSFKSINIIEMRVKSITSMNVVVFRKLNYFWLAFNFSKKYPFQNQRLTWTFFTELLSHSLILIIFSLVFFRPFIFCNWIC